MSAAATSDTDNTNTSDNPLVNDTSGAGQCQPASIPTRLFASSNVGTNEERNDLALARLRCAGFDIGNPEAVHRQFLRFAGTDAQRAADLQNIATGAIPAPKFLMGVRGGYGAMRLLPLIDWASLGRIMHAQGSILVGFSDVTAIQCALLAQGHMSSMAGPMLYSEFGKSQPDPETCQQFVRALTDPNLSIATQTAALTSSKLPTILSQQPSARITGQIWGGNLSVVSSLVGSPYLPQPDGGIVFLEDVGEQPYRVERMLYNLYLAGAFAQQQAIVLGSFSSAGADSYDARYDMAEVVSHLYKLTGLPIYSGFGFGHVGDKHSFPLGATATIIPDQPQQGFTLAFSDYPTLDPQQFSARTLWLPMP